MGIRSLSSTLSIGLEVFDLAWLGSNVEREIRKLDEIEIDREKQGREREILGLGF